MDRYGLASGHITIADREFDAAHAHVLHCMGMALTGTTPRLAGRELKGGVRRLVRAALDVERQRAFERGIEAFAAMPMVRERHDEGRSNRWTPGVYSGD